MELQEDKMEATQAMTDLKTREMFSERNCKTVMGPPVPKLRKITKPIVNCVPRFVSVRVDDVTDDL